MRGTLGRGLFPALFFLASVLPESGALESTAGQNGRWRDVLAGLEAVRDSLSANLEAVHAALLDRARRDDWALAEKLAPSTARPHPQGYGILPRLDPDVEGSSVAPERSVYSLEWLDTRLQEQASESGSLRVRVESNAANLPALVESFEALRKGMQNSESHLGYHRFWQEDVLKHAAFFAGRNELHTLVDRWQKLERSVGPSDSTRALRKQVLETLAPFEVTPRLAVVREDSDYVLRLNVVTDILDDAFLGEFGRAVETHINRSQAAIAKRFRVDLAWVRIPREALYPEGPPETGKPIDENRHLSRFPTGSLVLTTGARATHAFVGRYVQLGSENKSPRSLAHEFCHLLGFSDAYLRAYSGNPSDPFGVVFVEWSGLEDNLMGSPSKGRFTEAMTLTLLDAYFKDRGP